jgi:hypothetical protein
MANQLPYLRCKVSWTSPRREFAKDAHSPSGYSRWRAREGQETSTPIPEIGVN